MSPTRRVWCAAASPRTPHHLGFAFNCTPGEAERSFRYAPLSSGLDIVRKTLNTVSARSQQIRPRVSASGDSAAVPRPRGCSCRCPSLDPGRCFRWWQPLGAPQSEALQNHRSKMQLSRARWAAKSVTSSLSRSAEGTIGRPTAHVVEAGRHRPDQDRPQALEGGARTGPAAVSTTGITSAAWRCRLL
jgi:hypothetical protein